MYDNDDNENDTNKHGLLSSCLMMNLDQALISRWHIKGSLGGPVLFYMCLFLDVLTKTMSTTTTTRITNDDAWGGNVAISIVYYPLGTFYNVSLFLFLLDYILDGAIIKELPVVHRLSYLWAVRIQTSHNETCGF